MSRVWPTLLRSSALALRLVPHCAENVSASFYVGAVTDSLDDFDRRATTFGDFTYDVFVVGQGPAIVVLPESSGITPDVADFARRVIVLDHFRQKLQN